LSLSHVDGDLPNAKVSATARNGVGFPPTGARIIFSLVLFPVSSSLTLDYDDIFAEVEIYGKSCALCSILRNPSNETHFNDTQTALVQSRS
jgi:hypothetical protein